MAADPVALAQELIRCRSVTPADDGALPLLAEKLRVLGFDCQLLTFSTPGTPDVLNLWARKGRGRPHFCFAGHSDVVPVGDASRWANDPFAGDIVDGRLIGRGAADMKGAVAAFIAAADGFLSGQADFPGSLSLMITGDEEGPSVNGTIRILDWLEARGEQIDACLVGEPTSARALGDMVKIGRRGSLNGWLTANGVAGHTGYPQLADNAAHRLVTMLGALTAEKLDAGSGHFEPSTLQISTIDVGNPATNIIPARASACFNVRFNDLWNSARVEERLRALLDATGGDYDLRIVVSGESFLTSPGELSRSLSEAITVVTGRTPDMSTGGGTSDARFIRRMCPVVEFGLVGQTMHKPDEWVWTKDIETLAAIYRELLERFFAAANAGAAP